MILKEDIAIFFAGLLEILSGLVFLIYTLSKMIIASNFSFFCFLSSLILIINGLIFLYITILKNKKDSIKEKEKLLRMKSARWYRN